jgi:integrase
VDAFELDRLITMSRSCGDAGLSRRGSSIRSVIALWLGHEHVDTTQIYLHADLATKERAIARTAPPDAKPGRYRPSDALLAFLDGL